MLDRPYYGLMEQTCRSNGWVLGQDKGEMVLGVPQQDGSQVSVVVNDFTDSSGQPAMRMWSPVAPVDKVPPDQALTVNYQLPHGCLAENQGQIVLKATRIVKLTNQADLTILISTLAYYAAFYAKHFGQ